MPNLLHFFLEVNLDNEIDIDKLDLLTRQLGMAINDATHVESVKPAWLGDLPSGTKSSDPVTAGLLMIATLPAILPALIEFIKSWTLRANDRSITIKVQEGDKLVEVSYPVKGDTSKEQAFELAQELKMLLKGKNS